jgi:Acetyltransferase (GNAT) domain
MTGDRSILLLEPKLEQDYDRFLHALGGSLLYYSSPYRSFLLDLLACDAEYYLAIEDGRITGVLPLMMRDGPFGRVINSLPYYGSHGGVVASSEWARGALVQQYNDIVRRPDIAAATIVSHPLHPEANLGVLFDLTDDRIGQISHLDGLAGFEASLLRRIDGSARRNIRKADREGVEVTARSDALGFLERTHRENMREIGGKPKSPEFFARIPKYFVPGRDYDVYVAERAGDKLAALLVFYFNRTVEYFTPATRVVAREIQPMALILRQAMLDAAARGFTRWNWGGTWITQDGVYRFKKKWAADDHPYRYYVKINEPAILHARKDDLLAGYPEFFVLPFAQLAGSTAGALKNE